MADVPSLLPVSIVPGADALQGVSDGVMATAAWIGDRHNLFRVGWFIAGYAMIIAGLVILTKPAVDTATAVVGGTVGKAVKAVI